MTKREEIEKKYKDLFGRKARKDYTDEQLIAKIEKELGSEFKLESIPPEEDPDETPPTQQSSIPPEEDPDDEPPGTQEATAKPPKKEKKSKHPFPIREGNLHLVYINGSPRQYTKPVIEAALKTKNMIVEFPEETEFISDAKLNKCTDC